MERDPRERVLERDREWVEEAGRGAVGWAGERWDRVGIASVRIAEQLSLIRREVPVTG